MSAGGTWRKNNAANPFHLLIQGGDQLYADAVWREVPALAAWRQLDSEAQQQAMWTPAMANAAADFYFDRYCRLWSQPDVAPLLASIPSLMMWDDHDIFDGWGSHAPELQRCPVFQGLWSVAREFFALFQLGTVSKALPDMFGDPDGRHFGYAVTVGEVGILLADLRSRNATLTASWATRAGLGLSKRWRKWRRVGRCCSSRPCLWSIWTGRRWSAFWTRAQWFRNYHDDIRDQWRSHGHLDEWRRMATALLDFADRTHTRVTILSGEIHLGALGLMERGDNPDSPTDLLRRRAPSSATHRLGAIWLMGPACQGRRPRRQRCSCARCPASIGAFSRRAIGWPWRMARTRGYEAVWHAEGYGGRYSPAALNHGKT